MTPTQFYRSSSPEVIGKIVKKADTTLGNFKHIALFNGSVGKALAAKLAKASKGQMSELEILYPERYEEKKAG